MEKHTTDTLILAAKLRSQDAQIQINNLSADADVLRSKRDELSSRLNGLSSRCAEQRRRINQSLSLVINDLDGKSQQIKSLSEQRKKATNEMNQLITDGAIVTAGDAQTICDNAYQAYVSSISDSSNQGKETPQELSQQAAGIENESQHPDKGADPDKAYNDYVNSFNQQDSASPVGGQAADLNWK